MVGVNGSRESGSVRRLVIGSAYYVVVLNSVKNGVTVPWTGKAGRGLHWRKGQGEREKGKRKREKGKGRREKGRRGDGYS
jgi:hypothetical protein